MQMQVREQRGSVAVCLAEEDDGANDRRGTHPHRGALAPTAAPIIAQPLVWRLGVSTMSPVATGNCGSSGLALYSTLLPAVVASTRC